MNQEYIKQQLATLNLKPADQEGLLKQFFLYFDALNRNLSERTQAARYNRLAAVCEALGLKILDVCNLLREPEKITINQPWMNRKPEDQGLNPYSGKVQPLEGEAKKMMDLVNLCKPVQVFDFEGVLFEGYYVDAVKEYVKQNPSKKFFIWLQDNYKQLS